MSWQMDHGVRWSPYFLMSSSVSLRIHNFAACEGHLSQIWMNSAKKIGFVCRDFWVAMIKVQTFLSCKILSAKIALISCSGGENWKSQWKEKLHWWWQSFAWGKHWHFNKVSSGLKLFHFAKYNCFADMEYDPGLWVEHQSYVYTRTCIICTNTMT